MKTLKTIFVISLIFFFTSSIYSQNDETYYFYTTSTLYSDNGNDIIFTEVQRINCSNMKNGTSTLTQGIEKLLGEYLEKADIANWNNYNRLAWCLFKEEDAIKHRENQIIAFRRLSDYTIKEDTGFQYNCEYIVKRK